MTSGTITRVNFDQTRHKLLTEQQMRDTEQRAMASGHVTGLSMMETAGCGVVDALLQSHPQFGETGNSAAVLCGPGNNGGDGYVIARCLHQLGWKVTVFHYGNPDRLPTDAAENARLWAQLDSTHPLSDLTAADVSGQDVVIDALFGTGLTRSLGTEIVTKLDMVAQHATTIIAVDMPSGVSADSGKMLKNVQAETPPAATGPQLSWPSVNHIITFQRMKPGHLFWVDAMSQQTGADKTAPILSIVDLGIEDFEPSSGRKPDEADPDHPINTGGIPAGLNKPNLAHKYQHGHAVVCAGGSGHGGAGRLAARAALRVGAGAVTLTCPSAALMENAAQLNAIMLTPIATVAELETLLTDTRKNSLCLGPGMGRGQNTRSLVCAALKSQRPIVLDADALTSFEEDPSSLFARLHENAVLTPHSGEFARLFPDLVRVEEAAGTDTNGSGLSGIEKARQAAKMADCCILLKGAVTIIAAPDGRTELSAALGQRQVPWLATAGAGDVLAGFITGLMARGFDPFEAARAGTWLHVECARMFGPGLIAEDLPDMLPRVLQQIEAETQ
ncbi:NAD(P)H-hydrate dehydratase [Pararhizobium sp. IMCC21322]|uniref:NAD(P)H-hydrate dehydratase n=1 Tax=Pararhizobium sp. IMCC21322 TaxID=3067903 RepID=UPI002742775C|nr:NAD(P)H-hydrate dehydratase [Pararhizobium sp. IMCC21322]